MFGTTVLITGDFLVYVVVTLVLAMSATIGIARIRHPVYRLLLLAAAIACWGMLCSTSLMLVRAGVFQPGRALKTEFRWRVRVIK